jgi:hypothetical protein
MEQQILSQIIDNQLMMLKKMDELIKITSNLTNTIIKYDEEYQEQIVKEVSG